MSKWAESRLGLLSWCVLALAFYLRMDRAAATHLNPDEAIHFVTSNQASLAEAYRVSLGNAHPPLFFLVLYFLKWIGTSEIVLRLLPVLAGTGAVWLTSRWIGAVGGAAAGFIALVLLSFSHFLIVLDAEVRAYSLTLLWIAAALVCGERLFRDRSVRAAGWLGAFLALAALTHYSAAWFVAAMGLYVLLRVRDLPGRAAWVWAGTQAGVAGIYAWLYVTHLSKLHRGTMEAEATEGWLRALYYQPESQTAARFVTDATVGVFQTFFSDRYAGDALFIAFCCGVAAILWSGPRALAMLLIAPLVLNAAAGLLRLYPYGGSRHCIFLLPLLVAGASIAIARVVRGNMVVIAGAALLLVPLWSRRATPAPQEVPVSNQDKESMRQAMAYLRTAVPPGSVILADDQAGYLLLYYLGDRGVPGAPSACGGMREIPWGGYRLARMMPWSRPAGDFLRDVERWKSECGESGDPWVFDGGWGENLIDDMERVAPRRMRNAQRFGPSLSVFQLTP